MIDHTKPLRLSEGTAVALMETSTTEDVTYGVYEVGPRVNLYGGITTPLPGEPVGFWSVYIRDVPADDPGNPDARLARWLADFDEREDAMLFLGVHGSRKVEGAQP